MYTEGTKNTEEMDSNMKDSIKALLFKRLVVAALIIFVLITSLVAYNCKELFLSGMLDKGQSIAKIVEVGLNTHINPNSHEAQHRYIEILKNSNIANINIIHSPEITFQFPSVSHERPFNDPIIANVFKTKEASFTLTSLAKQDNMLRVTFPYIADYKKGIDCLSCHHVPEGTVLGVIDFYIDMTSYKNLTLNYLYLTLGIFSLSMLAIFFLLSRFMDQYVIDPLKDLLIETKNAYETHTSINNDDFDSSEFQDVAQKMDLFKNEILKEQEQLQEKKTQCEALIEEIQSTQNALITTMATIAEAQSKETAYHVRRVAQYAYLLGKAYGLSDQECEIIKSVTPMYDIGKIGIPNTILQKPEKLSEDEFATVKEHAKLGYEIFQNSSPHILLQAAAAVAYEHHERWDGKGYPRGLKGEEIHIYARIVAIASVFDTLITKRVHKEAWPLEDVLALLKEEKSRQFDPVLVDVFLAIINDIMKLKTKYDVLEEPSIT